MWINSEYTNIGSEFMYYRYPEEQHLPITEIVRRRQEEQQSGNTVLYGKKCYKFKKSVIDRFEKNYNR